MSEPDALDALAKELPSEAVAIVRRLARGPLVASDVLLAAIERTVAAVARAHDGDERVDLELAERVAHASRGLLALVGPQTPEAPRRLIQAAVLYFVLDDDAEHDIGSVVGFDDDALVMNAVIARLGHTELLIDIP